MLTEKLGVLAKVKMHSSDCRIWLGVVGTSDRNKRQTTGT